MSLMQVFFVLWFLILPILGILTPIFTVIFWVFIVPKVAKMLTWARFRSVSVHAIADDSGYVELVTTDVELPEGVVRTKRGWRFLPRPIWKPLKKRKKNPFTKREVALEGAEKLALKKYVLKGLGKPFFLGYAGMVAAMNPATVAALQQTTKNPINLTLHFNKIYEFANDMPKHFRRPLTKMLDELKSYSIAKPLTLIDPRAVKEILPEMTPPSLMEAIETYSEMVGMEEKGKQYGRLIIGGALIIGLVVLGVVAMLILTK